MAAIGQLIMCYVLNIDDATIIFRAIITVARSEKEGVLINGEETYCEKEKKKIKSYYNKLVLFFYYYSRLINIFLNLLVSIFLNMQ